jgi:hypothetical protein
MRRSRLYRARLGAAVSLLCAPLALGAREPRPAHPDLSGVWTEYLLPGERFALPALDMSLPFTAAGRAKVQAYTALVGGESDNPGAHCLGSGMPESMTFSGVYPMEIIQRPEYITVIYEAHTEVRHWYFAAKVIPPGDRVPARNGYSTAHWEGSTLVVETTALKEQEDQMFPHSEQALIVERYHLATDANGAKLLIADWTLTDPSFYTRPVIGRKRWALDPKGILLPYECNEEAWLDHLEDLRKKGPHR